MRFEFKDIFYLCPAPAVNALRIVTNYRYISVGFSKHFDYLKLGTVCILVFINKDELKPVLVFSKYIRVTFKKKDRVNKQVIKIHCVIFQHTALVFPVNTRYDLLKRICYGNKIFREDQFVLKSLNITAYGPWLRVFSRDPVFFHYRFNQLIAVVIIINSKIPVKPYMFGFNPEYPGKYRMECTHPYISCRIANQLVNPLLHFIGSFIGKSKCQYLKGIYSGLDQVCNFICKDPCFSAACTCNNHAGTIDLLNSFPLLYIKIIL